MVTVRLARMAMACRFELVLHGDDSAWLRAAGEEALNEISRIEKRLTIFDPSSEVSRLNAHAAHKPVRVSTALFRLLTRARRLHELSDGAFDLTVAPLMRAWGFFRNTGHLPDEHALAEARSRTGMDLVELDPESFTVRFKRDGVMLDFGAIGKGYAVDEAVRVLRDAGVAHAFLHGGTSTMYACGTPVEEGTWKVAIPRPDTNEDPLAIVELNDESLSMSAVWGKAFVADGRTYGHVLDPRLGRPVDGAMLAAVVAPGATEGDALSTALLVEGERFSETGARHAADLPFRALAVVPDQNKDSFRVVEFGLPALRSAHETPLRPPLENDVE